MSGFWTFWISKLTNFKTRLWTRDMCHVVVSGRGVAQHTLSHEHSETQLEDKAHLVRQGRGGGSAHPDPDTQIGQREQEGVLQSWPRLGERGAQEWLPSVRVSEDCPHEAEDGVQPLSEDATVRGQVKLKVRHPESGESEAEYGEPGPGLEATKEGGGERGPLGVSYYIQGLTEVKSKIMTITKS